MAGRGVRLEPIGPEHAQRIADFNRRMDAGGSSQHLSLGQSFSKIARTAESPIRIHSFVLCMGDDIRGGVNVKVMPFRVAGETRDIAFYNRPLSEGIVDDRFAMVGTMIHKLTQRQFPEIYGLGVGSRQEPVARLMTATGWSCDEVPFHFGVLAAAPFLRETRRLHTSAARSTLVRVLAATGLGALGLGFWRASLALGGRRPRVRGLELSSEESWGSWADDCWTSNRDRYGFVGERSRRVLEALFPAGGASGAPPFRRVRVRRGGRDVGWAVTLHAQLDGHNHFGSLRLGSIIDAFGAPEDAVFVVSAALRDLEGRCDLVVANFGHEAWSRACRRVGLQAGPSNFLLFLSKSLQQVVPCEHDILRKVFVTRGDGDGPANLY